MVTTQLLCLEDGARVATRRRRAWRWATRTASLFRYLDTFPRPDGIPEWPDLIPEPTPDEIDDAIRAGDAPYGTPDEVAGALQKYDDAGVDQVVFGLLSSTMARDLAVEIIETFGSTCSASSTPTPCTARRACARRSSEYERPDGAEDRSERLGVSSP